MPRPSAFGHLRSGTPLVPALLLLLAAATAGALEPVPDHPGRYALAEGLEVQRIMVDRGGRTDAAILTVLRVDPAHYDLTLLTAARHDGARTVEEWVEDFDLVGAFNASMYMPNLRSTGFLVDGDHINNGAVNPRLGGFLAFGPRHEGLPPVVLEGRDCPGFSLERLRDGYTTVVQNYRLLGCAARPETWSDRKVYASVALGLDRAGRLVVVHTGTPFAMNDFARWLADSPLDLQGALFAEGGWDSSLLVREGGQQLREIGRHAAFANARPPSRPLPNVLGLRRRH